METKQKEEAWKPKRSKKEPTPKKLAGPLGQSLDSPNSKRALTLNLIRNSHAWVEMMKRENLFNGTSKLKYCIRSLNPQNPRAPRIILLIGEMRENESLNQSEFTLYDPTGDMIGTFKDEVTEKLDIKQGSVICLQDVAWFQDKVVIMDEKKVEYIIDSQVRVEESLFQNLPKDLSSIYETVQPQIEIGAPNTPLKSNFPFAKRRPISPTASSPKKAKQTGVQSNSNIGFSFASEPTLPREKVKKVLNTQKQVAAKPSFFGTKMAYIAPSINPGFEFTPPSNELPKSPIKPKVTESPKKIPIDDSEEQAPLGSLDFGDDITENEKNKYKSDSSDGDKIEVQITRNRKRRIITDDISPLRKKNYSSEESESSHGEDVTIDKQDIHNTEIDSKYEVQKVHAKKIDEDGRIFYLLEFVGFDDFEWHPKEMCFCDRLIDEFENREHLTQDTDNIPDEPEPDGNEWVGKRTLYFWHNRGEVTDHQVDVLKYNSNFGYRVRYQDDSEEWISSEDIRRYIQSAEDLERSDNLLIAIESNIKMILEGLISDDRRFPIQNAPITAQKKLEESLQRYIDEESESSDDQSESKRSQSSGEMKVYTLSRISSEEVDNFQPSLEEEEEKKEETSSSSSEDDFPIFSSHEDEDFELFKKEIDDDIKELTQRFKTASQSVISQLSQAVPAQPLDSKEIVVVSVYDGIGAAAIALKNLSIKVKVYITFEIDKDAIAVVKRRIEGDLKWKVEYLGDVTKVTHEKAQEILDKYGPPDLIIGGSPCQDLSILNRNRVGLTGDKSKVFFTFPELIDVFLKHNPNLYFLFENVASMPIVSKGTISDLLGLEPVRLNANIVSGAKRNRYYWSNIPRIRAILPKVLDLNQVMSPDFGNAASGTLACITTTNIKRNFSRFQNYDKKQKMLILKELKRYNAIITKDKKVRGVSHSEVERLLGFESGYTKIGLPTSVRARLLGCSFSVPIIEYLLSPLTSKEPPAPKPLKRRKQKSMDEYVSKKEKNKRK